MKAQRQSALGKQKRKNNKNKMYIFLFIANRDGLLFGEGAGTINHNRVNCWPPTTCSPMWNFILHCSTRYDCHEETPRSAFIQFIAKKGCQSRYTLYRLKQRQHPVSILAAEINTIINVVFTLPYFNLSILYLWNCWFFSSRASNDSNIITVNNNSPLYFI